MYFLLLVWMDRECRVSKSVPRVTLFSGALTIKEPTILEQTERIALMVSIVISQYDEAIALG